MTQINRQMKEAFNSIKATWCIQYRLPLFKTESVHISWFNQGGMDPMIGKWRQQSPLPIHLQINPIRSTDCLMVQLKSGTVSNNMYPLLHILSYLLIHSKLNRSEPTEMIGLIFSIKRATKQADLIKFNQSIQAHCLPNPLWIKRKNERFRQWYSKNCEVCWATMAVEALANHLKAICQQCECEGLLFARRFAVGAIVVRLMVDGFVDGFVLWWLRWWLMASSCFTGCGWVYQEVL